MAMADTVFTQIEFWLLIAFSIIVPSSIYGVLLAKKAISRYTVLGFGFALVVIAGGDVYLLQSLAAAAKLTPSPADDAVFLSELSLALYLLPAMFGGIGINVISHILVRHLTEAEATFQKNHPDA
jgi:hypothetical protein